jgi:hypothetical protein
MDPRIYQVFIIKPGFLFVNPFCYAVNIIGLKDGTVIGMTVGVGDQGGQGLIFPVKINEPLEINIKDNIPVEEDKVIAEFSRDLEERSGGSQGFRLAVILNGRAEAPAVPKVIPDDMPQMADYDGNIPKAVPVETFNLILKYGFPQEGNHGLGNIRGYVGDPGSLAAGHDYRFHGKK